MPRISYTLKRNPATCAKAKAGDVVYDCAHHDYGLARDDTNATGVEHKSVTLDPDGDYPFFTVPVKDLERRP